MLPNIEPDQFIQVADRLLAKYYGLGVNDTNLNSELANLLIESGTDPLTFVNEHAQDCDLDRVDLEGFYGVPSQDELTEADLLKAFEDLNYKIVYSPSVAALNDGDGYWSNEHGWGSLEGVSLFSMAEASTFSLPSVGVPDAKWVSASEAFSLPAPQSQPSNRPRI